MIKLLPLLLTLSFLTIACSTPENQTEATSSTTTTNSSQQQPQEGNVKINLVSPSSQETVKMGNAQLVVEVLDSQTQKPVAVKDLDIKVSMPMEGDEPMTSMAKVEPDSQPGRYKIKTNFGMQGKWDVVAQVKDSQHQGQASYSFNVQ